MRASIVVVAMLWATPVVGGMTTWDGRHSIDRIEVTIAYFVPQDRTPLPDWRERVDYFAKRIETFHAREFGDQSVLATKVHETPYRSTRTTAELRKGDANAIFFRTLREVDAGLKFAVDRPVQVADNKDAAGTPFPILLVLSDVNWRPLDDFWRLKPEGDGFAFEGQLTGGVHRPGAASGGARATYLADRGCGWGLVSADGWRVPYVGSDCVVYHEGVGHAIGLPHPEPANGSVMSMGQYEGWLSQSWVDEEQKRRLGWVAPEAKDRDATVATFRRFTKFRVVVDPLVPKPGDLVTLKIETPEGAAAARRFHVRCQTDLFGPWIEPAGAGGSQENDSSPAVVPLGRFDSVTPVSYRVKLTDESGSEELWGYFQVRADPQTTPLPAEPLAEFTSSTASAADVGRDDLGPAGEDEVDLLAQVDPRENGVSGTWTKDDQGRLVASKQYGARIELPGTPPEEYRLTAIVQPLDEPNGLILGQRSGKNRFLVLLNYGSENPTGAVENVDGQNVGSNETTFERRLFKKDRLSQVIVDVRKERVRVMVDGGEVIDWHGDASRLSLGDYWATPNAEALFVGAYDCRYRFHRLTIAPLGEAGAAANASR